LLQIHIKSKIAVLSFSLSLSLVEDDLEEDEEEENQLQDRVDGGNDQYGDEHNQGM